MLFEFNYFWKSTLTLVGAWACYGLFGYEFAVISLLSVLVMCQLHPRA